LCLGESPEEELSPPSDYSDELVYSSEATEDEENAQYDLLSESKDEDDN
jgi:hypothetical protein